MNIGKIIKEIRKDKGFNQVEFAEMCGISQTTLSQIETGTKRPRPATLKKICQKLEVPETFLYLLATEEKDIPKNKKDIYKMLFPTVENMLKQIIAIK